MTFSMTLTRTVTTHYVVTVEAESLAEACKKAEQLDPERLDEFEREPVELTTSDHDWEE